ncbi:hypothetical protein NFI96_033749 [Prochilodus magdalenae]|nr:hypothetical protein NFI96_033749 [Prochilodus magdalenae]
MSPQVAIKYVSKGSAAEELDIPGQGSMPLEVALMTLANAGPPCSNILQLYEWFDEPTRYIMILERPDQCQDLFDFREDRGGSLPESLARKVMLQLVNALRHCKSRGIVHRDVKPENLLIQKNTHNIKLIDFGCGTLLNTSAYKKFAGTRQYAPPEWFLEHQYLAEPATVCVPASDPLVFEYYSIRPPQPGRHRAPPLVSAPRISKTFCCVGDNNIPENPLNPSINPIITSVGSLH